MKKNIFLDFLFLFCLLSAKSFAAPLACSDLFRSPHTTGQVISTLKNMEKVADEVKAQLAHKPLSEESVDYIRKSVGIQEMSVSQVHDLYKNNLWLLAERAQKKAEDLILQRMLKSFPIETLKAQIDLNLEDLAKRLGMPLSADQDAIKSALKEAVHNTSEENFSLEEIKKIVALRVLRDLPYESIATRRDVFDAISDELTFSLKPSIASKLEIKKLTGCCRGGTCRSCPNSLRLKREIRNQGFANFNIHLKRIPGTNPPAELKLFEMQAFLESLVPDVNW